MPIIPTESEVLHMKKTHGLDEREMELVKLLMADCQTTGDIQANLKKLFAGTIEQMLEAEMDEHLGYEKNSVAGNNSGNSRNGYGKKTIISDYGECEIAVPAKIVRAQPRYPGDFPKSTGKEYDRLLQ